MAKTKTPQEQWALVAQNLADMKLYDAEIRAFLSHGRFTEAADKMTEIIGDLKIIEAQVRELRKSLRAEMRVSR